MEILSNLAWGAVVLVLCGLWLNGHWHLQGRAISLRPAIGVQLVALAMVSAVLLPPISITDDLHAMNIPAEVERTLPRTDRQQALHLSPHQVPAHEALPVVSPVSSGLQCIAFLHRIEPMPPQPVVYSHTLWSRPPPAPEIAL